MKTFKEHITEVNKFIEGSLFFNLKQQDRYFNKAKKVLGKNIDLEGRSVLEFSGLFDEEKQRVIEEYIKLLNNGSYIH